MDHNKFDYENDLLFPLKDFLKRNTNFSPNDLAYIEIPGYLKTTPEHLKNDLISMSMKDTNYGCFGVDDKSKNLND